MIEVVPGVFRHKLPLAREVAAFAALGGRSLVDLTQRPRGAVERACAKYGVSYHKFPLPYVGGDLDGAIHLILSLRRPVLFHCFHGRDRTGRVANALRMRTVGRVVLYRVGRNLNRAVRTCEAFGIPRIELVECDARIAGNLYGAAGRVEVATVEAIPITQGALALETGTPTRIERVDWSTVDTIILGGETSGLPRSLECRYGTIATCGKVSGLTVEGALAVALYQWGLSC